MPISLSDLQTPQTKEQVRDTLTGFLVTLGFPVDAWQDGGAARSFLEMMSSLGASFTNQVAAFSKSVDLETAADEYLDVKARSDYDETRAAAVSAVFDATFTNAGATTHGPLAAGSIIMRSTSGQLFENTGIETITASSVVVVEVIAQSPGAAGNIGSDTLQLVTPLAGVTVATDGTLTTAGADAEDDPRLRDRCRTKWATLRVEKTRDGVINLAKAASDNIDAVSVLDSNPRGPGTVDVFVSAENATSGSSDVALVQAALDLAFLGNGTVDQLVQAFAAPTVVQNIAATVFVQGITSAEATSTLTTAWQEFVFDIPLGGFDLSPGPSNVVQTAQIIEALVDVVGVKSVSLTDPAADVTIAANTKVLVGTIAFTIVVVSV